MPKALEVSDVCEYVLIIFGTHTQQGVFNTSGVWFAKKRAEVLRKYVLIIYTLLALGGLGWTGHFWRLTCSGKPRSETEFFLYVYLNPFFLLAFAY